MKYGTFDIESTNWIDFEVLGFFDGQTYKNFWSIAKFLDALDKPYYKHFRFYAHNGGRFDFLFLLERLLLRGWVAKIIERQGRIIQIRVNTGKTQFSFCDSYAILPQALRKLSDAFKPKHRKLTMDYKKVSAHDPKTLHYLENDVYCLWEILYDFFSSEFIAQPQLTIASQALNTFSKKFWQGEVVQMRIYHENIIRNHYYSGGRVEMFKGYGKNIHVYDVNSLFPSVMLESMPMGECKVVSRYVKGKPGFYHVRIKNTPEWYISPLLHRGVKLMFVNGPGEYYLGTPTLELLREMDVSFTVLHGYAFHAAEKIFTDYVRTFYDLKQKAGHASAMYVIAKLFLNALYGKFGARRERETIVPASGFEEGALLPGIGTLLDTYGMVLIKEESHSRFIAPYLAAYITELARVHHFRLMNQHPHAMFYCDTDSLFTTAHYPIGKKIGELSLQGTYKEGVFLGNKTYALRNGKEEKIAFRGFSTEDIDFNDVRAALEEHEPIVQTGERILSARECLTAKNISKKRGAFLKMRKTRKQTRLLDYDKRECYLKSGCIVDSKPFNLSSL